MENKLEKLLYDIKYTGGAYLDAGMTIPIWTSGKVTDLSGKILKEKNPKFLSRKDIQDNSVVYKKREKLREKLDTRPGVLYLESNVVGAIPFALIGMPAAELTQAGIDHWISNTPEILQYVINSTFTLASQMAFGYTTFMANEVRTNKYKYIDERGKLSTKKIASGLFNAVKAFLSFDIPYTLGKIGGQSLFLYQGKDPWKASGLFDVIALPAWYTLVIPLGLHKGVIETKETDRIYSSQTAK